MELKEGMYVKTKITDNCNCVYIRKIIEIEDDSVFNYNQIYIDEAVVDGWGDDRIVIDVEEISKASNNIIDLIEIGDYVNGYKVNRIEENYVVINEIWTGRELLKNEDIKSILTKEQFESMSYKVN